jgi:hypothetical protein
MSDELGRLKKENLVSFVVIASNDAATDIKQVTAMSEFSQGSFDYYELLVVASSPGKEWLRRFRQFGSHVPQLRIISIEAALGFDELTAAALRFAIGDLIVCVHPGEIEPGDVEQMMRLCARGDCDLVKAFHPTRAQPMADQLLAAVVRRFLRLSTGREVQPFQARGFAMTRTALTRLQGMADVIRYFRIVDLSGSMLEGSIELRGPSRRGLLTGVGDRFRTASALISSSAARLVLWLAVVCAVLSLSAIGFALMALLLWIVLDDIVRGWTSLAMVLSLLFAANFGVMATICLGLLHIIRQSTPDPIELFATEWSGGDLFSRGDRLNVEGTSGDDNVMADQQ